MVSEETFRVLTLRRCPPCRKQTALSRWAPALPGRGGLGPGAPRSGSQPGSFQTSCQRSEAQRPVPGHLTPPACLAPDAPGSRLRRGRGEGLAQLSGLLRWVRRCLEASSPQRILLGREDRAHEAGGSCARPGQLPERRRGFRGRAGAPAQEAPGRTPETVLSK